MFKEILAGWLIFQLFVIGMSVGIAQHEMKHNELECKDNGSVLVSTMFPLIYFMDSDMNDRLAAYCNNK